MLNPHRLGCTLATLVGGLHLLWSVMVAVGAAQVWFDLVTRLHFVKIQLIILPFDIVSAVLLIILTTLIGYVVGNLFAMIWNKVQE